MQKNSAVKQMDNKVEEKLNVIQHQLRKKIHCENNFSLDELKLVAGVDIAYWSDNEVDYGVCCIQVFDYLTKKVIEEVEYVGKVEFPYISGYLAFRELPLIVKAVQKLKNTPDLYMFDGNGYLHIRNMGIATHASIELGKPTIGVAKTYSKIKNVNFTMPPNSKGTFTDIVVDGEVYGRALRTRVDVKPIFVSCGNWIDLNTATQITMHFVEEDSRLPITIRYADLATHEARKYQKLMNK
ncbi:Endonuclease V [Fictibacillus enclensis]|uniref:Endonuclease V n=1 Tax=Fictibacillus enclensis TaxID=1017270 RepID=A0A0V8J5Y7_9BACL|nr:endonuclease V [Fictibacillus enclensis]KSU82096.1 endonuclease V [Fictibacillus enclensis]SCC30277.1 Endonuclease V [Fictibacillus enclensis]